LASICASAFAAAAFPVSGNRTTAGALWLVVFRLGFAEELVAV
jgi:hypothetical protein